MRIPGRISHGVWSRIVRSAIHTVTVTHRHRHVALISVFLVSSQNSGEDMDVFGCGGVGLRSRQNPKRKRFREGPDE